MNVGAHRHIRFLGRRAVSAARRNWRGAVGVRPRAFSQLAVQGELASATATGGAAGTADAPHSSLLDLRPDACASGRAFGVAA